MYLHWPIRVLANQFNYSPLVIIGRSPLILMLRRGVPRCLAVFSRTFCKLSVNIALVLFSEFWYFGVLGSHLVHCFTVVHLYQTLAFKVRYSWTRGVPDKTSWTRGVPDKTSWMRGVPNFDWGPACKWDSFHKLLAIAHRRLGSTW